MPCSARMSSGGRISLDIHRSCCEAPSNLILNLSLRACEAISLFSLRQLRTTEIAIPRGHIALRSLGQRRDRHAALAMTQYYCHCEPAKQSLFWCWRALEGEIAIPRGHIALRSLGQRRDRHAALVRTKARSPYPEGTLRSARVPSCH